MIDFIEYVVGELKSRRLSRKDALDLIKQFSLKAPPKGSLKAPFKGPGAGRDAALHPLVQANTSDLAGQRFSSIFTGEEFFLADHRIRLDGGQSRMILPGVAYLEMAREAVARALPQEGTDTILELRDVMWAQPLVVAEPTEVSIAMDFEEAEGGVERIAFEITSVPFGQEGGSGERIHCRGRAAFVARAEPARLDLERMRGRMGKGKLDASLLYATYRKVGADFGPSHRSMAEILTGEGEALARLVLPQTVAGTLRDFALHPSLLDGALQACIALLPDPGDPGRPSLPFALDALEILSPCADEMFAWIRHAAGRPGDRLAKVDIDLCDGQGRVCIRLRAFSSRTPVGAIAAGENPAGMPAASVPAAGLLFAAPAWKAVPAPAPGKAPDFGQVHVLLSGFREAGARDLEGLEALLPGSRCRSLAAVAGEDFAGTYGAAVSECLGLLREIIAGKPMAGVLVQIAVAGTAEGELLAGLQGMLRTARLENPQVTGQILLVDPGIAVADLAARLVECRSRPQDTLVRYSDDRRHVSTLEEIPGNPDSPAPAFKARGVYLITGGLGGLGVAFARAILDQCQDAEVILAGRSEWDERNKALLDGLSPRPGQVAYRRADISDPAQAGRLVAGILEERGRLDGILHAAGILRDSFILKHEPGEVHAVLAPKVAGTCNLDQASRDVDLDFLALFSSGAAVTGNGGQSGYAAANGFMDRFASLRNQLVARGERRGRTLSINWPLWEAGGMGMDEAGRTRAREAAGMQPMRTAAGIQAFHRCLEMRHPQVLVVEGDLARLRETLLTPLEARPETTAPEASASAAFTNFTSFTGAETGDLGEKTLEYITSRLSSLLKMAAHRIDPDAPLEKFGIDSILAMNLTQELEKTFGPLSKTLFFEYQTLRDLGAYFVKAHAPRLAGILSAGDRPAQSPQSPAPQPPAALSAPSVPSVPKAGRHPRRGRLVPRAEEAGKESRGGKAPDPASAEPIAIIGLSGRYPEAIDIEAYGRNLRDGKDCIVEVPRDRWDWREYYTPDRNRAGSHYSKWGGFIAGVDEFDPRFFNISPVEAELIDPQERLFLQHAWMAVEDAGYSRAGLQVSHAGDLPGQVGVYAGVMYSEYQLFGAEAGARGRRLGVPGSYASIANRVSYLLNLHGPSLALDSMCSSSLTAIHLACQDLKLGRTSLAIAGGVNVSIHPNKYLVISAGQFISGDGHCQSFGEGGEGYIPGEGVGVVVLKRLSDALRDGDHVYGLIKGSAINHGGKTNGYSVPNPQAQAGVIALAMAECGIDARHLSYVEAHGTGTKLGDPIEIAALTQAFRRHTGDNGYCLIGSAKSNIGHCESAAGIAGLTKVLLQMRHRQIFPSLHSARLNPHIDFAKTPFVVNQTLRAWDRPRIDGREIPRLAGISSFGAGGSNAHLIVEEFTAPPAAGLPVILTGAGTDVAIVLSARTGEQLEQKVRDLLAFIRRPAPGADEADGEALGRGPGALASLASLAYTLQTGREPMDERLGFVAASFEELDRKLEACLRGGHGDVFRGKVEREQGALALFSADADLQQTVGKWIAQGKLVKLLGLWVQGLKLDWNLLYGGSKPKRASLPAYPFARERYWLDVDAIGMRPARAGAALHPLLHGNVSDLSRQRYVSTFNGKEPFLADHQVRMESGTKGVFPAAACLEMARAAVENAVPQASGVLELRDMVWTRPLVVEAEKEVSIALTAEDGTSLKFAILSGDGEGETGHFEGWAAFVAESAPAPLDIPRLREEMGKPALDASRLYAAYAKMGLAYGPSHRCVAALWRGEGQLLARLRLPDAATDGLEDYLLHPSLVDGALQAALGLADPDQLPDQPALPFALRSLRVLSACAQDMFAWVRQAREAGTAGRFATPAALDIDLCDGEGRVCAQLRGLASRPLPARRAAAGEPGSGEAALLAVPAWEPAAFSFPPSLPPSFPPAGRDYAQHVILIDMPAAVAERLGEPAAPIRSLTDLRTRQASVAGRYGEAALQCFRQLRKLLASPPDGDALVQIVVAELGEQALFAGLSGLLRTATLENPRLTGQLILVEPEVAAEELSRRLLRERLSPEAPLVRYCRGERQVLRWQEQPAGDGRPGSAFREGGVYLITGGLGGLGTLFAREALEARGARVILTGRSGLPAEKRAALAELDAGSGRAAYRRLDLADASGVADLVASVVSEFGRLDGILHSAGMIADSFILKKTEREFLQVLEPKVAGTLNLDEASKDVKLDFLALFSSAAGALGNPGQADYAAANAFMDHFAAHRNRMAASGERYGHTLSCNWPLWQEGGMRLDPDGADMLYRAAGMRPMRTATGMAAFHRSLASGHARALVLEGDLTRLRALLRDGRAAPATPATPATPAATADRSNMDVTPAPAGAAAPEGAFPVRAAVEFLRGELSQILKLQPREIDAKAPLEKYGIDSILAMRLTGKLEEAFGPLPKTLFFEYQNLAALAAFFAGKYPERFREKASPAPAPAAPRDAAPTGKAAARTAAASAGRFLAKAPPAEDDVAIVGLSGRYPQADTLEEFWENLKAGKDCITEIPAERWDGGRFYDPDKSVAGRSRSKWGGFLADADKFDPLFFNISPLEAGLMDPQERLFLETAWHAVEDAGYSRERLAAGRVGVYVGVMYGQYELYGAEAMARGDAYVPGSSFASIANRVSYFFDFRGPSLAVDTMCSSSLTAIYLACEEIRKGGIDAAVAGGVNLSIHPQKYLLLSQGNFTASDGRCRSFGAGGDGYVPGEGVGAVLLKPLRKAREDGDHIYGVIKAVTLNHGGKTNGYTVPNPNAQADLVSEALLRSGIDPATLGYLEAHGTGTSLGDPIEIAGLMKAFQGRAGMPLSCPIGSVKSNIGHLESAAGIASLTKALLQLKHGLLVPSLHAEPLNPNIDFASTPFRVQTALTPWEAPGGHPRRLGISSFGAGGSNAHLILEEHADAPVRREFPASGSPEVFVISAKTTEALRRYAAKMSAFLEKSPDLPIAHIAFTSQVGRTPMKERLAVLASGAEELRDKLERWLASPGGNGRQGSLAGSWEAEGVFRDTIQGHIQDNMRQEQGEVGALMEGDAGEAFLRAMAENRELAKLAKLWVSGIDVDWALLRREGAMRRVSLPTYPFARERCWIKVSAPVPAAGGGNGQARVPAASATAAPAKVAGMATPRVQAVPAAPAPAADAVSPRRYAFQSRWPITALAPSGGNPPPLGPVLILDTGRELHREVKALPGLQASGHPAILVLMDRDYRDIAEDVVALDPGNEKHFQRLVAGLKARNLLPRRIIHRGMDPQGIGNGEGAAIQLERGVYALFHLCKALIKHRHQAVQIVSILSGEAEGTSPLHAALGGFFKTLAQENHKYQGKAVALLGGPEAPEARLAGTIRLLLEEFGETTWLRKDIRYRFEPGKQAYVRHVREIAPLPQAGGNPADTPFKHRGVYLISGGLGGLGLVFSAYLAGKFQAKLVLFGRSPLGGEQERKLARLKSLSPDVLYLQADVSRPADMEAVVQAAKTAFSRIDGVIHSAGMNRDNYLLKKTREEMQGVIGPKVLGALHLDLATRDLDLDLFVLFSSVAGVMGNPGQCDYAYGNHFLDAFAESRQSLRRAGRRSGRTLSISWPYWEAGGMALSPADIASAEERIGLCPLPTPEGILFFEEFLRSDTIHGIALYGLGSRIGAYVGQDTAAAGRSLPAPAESGERAEPFDVREKTAAYLKAMIGREIRLDPERLDPRERFEAFGIDSIVISRLNAALERDLGELPKTLFYEYETLQELTAYLAGEYPAALARLIGWDGAPPPAASDVPEAARKEAGETGETASASEKAEFAKSGPAGAEAEDDDGRIAIIGVHGCYPKSGDMEAFWENLEQGKDLIEPVPAGRWDSGKLYDPDPGKAAQGKIYCKWGGFLEDADKFDAAFFHIPPEEAGSIDPQERIFLESVWAAIEDAGYTRDRLKRRHPKGNGNGKSADVGVFVGVTTNSYQLLGPDEWARGNMVSPGAMPWSIANRVSYFFDFQGPSLPVDTACSSSLVAMHLAVESLQNRQCQVAIAGGVNLYLHPAKYLSFCQKRSLSPDGKCRSFGAGEEGFVPGEGVGTLVLKRLRQAVADGDRIHAVIAGSAYDHSGRSNGYSAPNPNSQAALIDRTLRKARIHPESIGYLEGHGTGTRMGDSLEVAALSQAFRKQTSRKQFCALGSVKANIGHSESAAGISGVAKALLQLKHRRFAPTLYAEPANPDIDFRDTPFYLQHGSAPWEAAPGHPRRAMINSFGAGGVNACLILEEYRPASGPAVVSEKARRPGPHLFVLSARDEDRLRAQAERLLAFLGKHPDVDPADLAHTLQVGREAMAERAAVIAPDAGALGRLLADWLQGRPAPEFRRGSVGRGQRKGAANGAMNGAVNGTADGGKTGGLGASGSAQDLKAAAGAWLAGAEIDWGSLQPGEGLSRIALPTYPFARERHWVTRVADPLPALRSAPRSEKEAAAPPAHGLHPLIHCNTSTLREISFSSRLSAEDFYARDHKVNQERIFPGSGYMELAYVAGNLAAGQRVGKLQDVVWVHPISFSEGPRTLCTYLKPAGNSIEYRITSSDGDREMRVHSEGRLLLQSGGRAEAKSFSIPDLKARCPERRDGDRYYDLFRRIGFDYGPSFRTIQEFHVNGTCALSRLKLADHLKPGFGAFTLHPSLLDGALQTVIGLLDGAEPSTPYLPFAIDEVEVLRPLSQTCYAWAELAGTGKPGRGDLKKFDITLLNEGGEVLVRLKGFYVRALIKQPVRRQAEAAVRGRPEPVPDAAMHTKETR